MLPKILHTEIRANRFNLDAWKREGGGESSPLSLRCHLHRSTGGDRPTNADRRCVLALPGAVIRASASLVPSPPSLPGSHRPSRKADQAGGVTANFSCQNERDVSGIVSPPSAANKTDEAALNSTRNRFYPPVPIESPASLHPIPSLA